MESVNPANATPMCPFCNNRSISVKHILMNCNALSVIRNQILFRGRQDLSLGDLLGNLCPVRNLFDFLEAIGVGDDI